MKVLEQRAAMEEETRPVSPEDAISFYTQSSDDLLPETPMESCHVAFDNTDEFHPDDLLLILDEQLKKETPPTPVSSMELRHDLPFILDECKKEPDVTSDANSSNDDNNSTTTNKVSSLRLPIGDGMLQELQLPKMNMDWTQDSFWTQLCSSPWLDNIMLASPYANILNT